MSEDSRINRFQSLRPERFYQVERLEVAYTVASLYESLLPQLIITLRTSRITDYPKLILSFRGVRQLRLDTSAFGIHGELHELSIISIRERQWERLDYQVEDENNVLFFYCHEFEMELHEPSTDLMH